MPVTIDRAFVESFKSNILHLAQQKESRLRNYVRYETMVGETHNFERIGAVDAVQRTTRHGDTPILDAPFSRRRVSPQDWEYGDMVDREDKLRLLISPESNIASAASKSLNRRTDLHVIEGALGDARDHTDAAVPLPPAQILTASGTGSRMAFDDLRRVKELFDANEVDDDDRIAVISSYQLNRDMLSMTEVTNADFNPVYAALANGNVTRWMGFHWIRSELLPKTATTRQCLFYDKNSVGLAVNDEMYSFIEPRWDKKGAHQIYARNTMGATRIEDVGVIRLDCEEV